MTVRMFRTTIIGTDLSKMQTIKTYIEGMIDSEDKAIDIQSVTLSDNRNIDEGIILSVNLFLDMSVDIDKYYNLISAHSNQLDKQGITSIRIIQDDDCGHDSSNPGPCDHYERYLWEA